MCSLYYMCICVCTRKQTSCLSEIYSMYLEAESM
jgi:hypothetical protein